jgi:hypothetical protein
LCGVHSKLSMRWAQTPKRKTTVLLCDGFAVLDREWPDIDSKLGGKRQRLARDVSGDRVGNVTRNRLSHARFTNDRWDSFDVCDRLVARLRRRRARQLRRLAARHAVSAVGRAALLDRRLRAGRRHALTLVVVVLIVVRSFHQEARDETGLIDGERVPAGRFAD